MAHETKTNVMRILDTRRVAYRHYSYSASAGTDGYAIAVTLGQNPNMVFKTLVTIARPGKYYVFLVPVCQNLDLKRAAASVGEKSLNMLPQRELLPLTGYVHGGCCPIGMKKQFVTVIDASAENFPTIIFSAGHVGDQVEMSVPDLARIVPLRMADICTD